LISPFSKKNWAALGPWWVAYWPYVELLPIWPPAALPCHSHWHRCAEDARELWSAWGSLPWLTSQSLEGQLTRHTCAQQVCFQV